MQLDAISNFDALFALLALIAFAGLVFRIVPVGTAPQPAHRYTQAEILAHDPALPKYLIVTLAALATGGLHLAIRSLPSVSAWLIHGGYGGHLLRDIAYSHMMIVMGGTVAVTGLSWYVLPRILQRPLYSKALAEIAFWGTVVGAAGFYLSNAIGGGAMAALLNNGWAPDDIDFYVGLWRNLGTGLFATIMGVGYWTFVINVFVTVLGGTGTQSPRPHLHLAKFFLVGAGALFIGTVQGVLQVVPESVDWLHAAGEAGLFIDPVSHAHVNLITGVLSILAGVVFYVTRGAAADDGARSRRVENSVFWVLIPASAAFYAAFLYLGFAEGNLIVDQGLTYAEASARLGWQSRYLIPVSGTLTFIGIWLFLAVAVIRLVRVKPRGAILMGFGTGLLALGTLQGVLQAMPPVSQWMLAVTPADSAIAGAHAQVNIIGGVLLLLLGSAHSVGVPMLPEPLGQWLLGRVGLLMGGGALIYYAAALAAALMAGLEIGGGGGGALGALIRAESRMSAGTVAGALAYTAGGVLLLRRVWVITAGVRRDGLRDFKLSLARNNSASDPWRRHVRPWQFILPEFLAALFGFPGVGWILSGRAMIGGPLILAGQAIAWAIIPMLISPYGDQRLPHLTPAMLEGYLVATAVVSTAVLWWISCQDPVSTARRKSVRRTSAAH
ncbi:hypothetical protein [Roseibium aggregatum]|uniref:Uncharacterized protein n=1 Tax=Roseibium aggregatum TaxID=187304 RepID=A0A926SAN8_9HYPH|nr:hypothetical protein [Roseibium aggregatum]MBD1549609.1 hypothetical protein [Roseibium aggregatum]